MHHRLYSDFRVHHATLSLSGVQTKARGLSCPRLVHRIFLPSDMVLEVNIKRHFIKCPRQSVGPITTRGNWRCGVGNLVADWYVHDRTLSLPALC